MSDKDRIRLAEAMGYRWREDKSIKEWPGMGHWYAPNGDRLPHSSERARGCGHGVPPTFNPFTDANDDYAALEWMRENWQGKKGHHGHWHQAALSLWWRRDEYDVIIPYRIGDYARAALKVLDNETY